MTTNKMQCPMCIDSKTIAKYHVKEHKFYYLCTKCGLRLGIDTQPHYTK